MSCTGVDPILSITSTKTYVTVTGYLTPPYLDRAQTTRHMHYRSFSFGNDYPNFSGESFDGNMKTMMLYYFINVHVTDPSENSVGHVKSNSLVEGSSQNHVFVSEQENKDITFSFALDSRTVLLNNSANTHTSAMMLNTMLMEYI